MEEPNETMVVEPTEEMEEFEDNSTPGAGAVIAAGVGLLTVAGAAGAAFVAKKTGKLDEIKAKHREKKIAKLEAKLEKAKATTIEKEDVEEKSEDED